MSDRKKEVEFSKLSSGIEGLDQILNGGYLDQNSYLIRGGPGTGKTTLGLHYLQEGLKQDNDVLYISLSEVSDKIIRNGESMGFGMDDMHFLDLTPGRSFFTERQSSVVFEDADIDLDPLIDQITEKVEQVQPQRIFVDSLTQFRFLSPSDYQFHKYALSLTGYLLEQAQSVLMVSEASSKFPDDDLQFLVDGVINLEWDTEERHIIVSKLRGADFSSGKHSYIINSEGMSVFPKLIPEKGERELSYEKMPFGIPEIDEMVHGGIERGCATLITGPAGVGKTTLGMQFMKESAGRGERSVIYMFEEKKEILVRRCEAIGIPIRGMLESGALEVIELSPNQYSLNQFNNAVKREVEEKGTSIIMIDSIRGYKLMSDVDDMAKALQPLNSYLKEQGVSLLLINEVESITGDFKITEVGISYMSDIVIFLRFMENRGEIEKAIGILKNRLSDYEKTMRRYSITRYGLKVGKPLTDMRGILSGSPDFINKGSKDN